ncbi:hypothetical protein VPNG_05647 [Cytospora leucostoma]|uniref:Uncharacterized protein n=1 Tax=Cytospora leucostoma TaxID=1230097 RepID=A0A423X7R3_9PEZI|nr:hypothetical protein VPNG_05647 [Cytospora leucostoma]
MPSPWSTSFKRRNATSEEGSKDTKRALDLGPWEPQFFAFSNRLGNASRSGKVTLPRAPSSRKRPANYEPQNEVNKSCKTSTTGTPQTSPSASKTTVKDQTGIAKNTRVVIDLTDDPDTLHLPAPSVGPDQYTLGSPPPRKIIRPSPISRRGLRTDPGLAVNNEVAFVDLTIDDDEDFSPSSLAHRSNNPHLLVDCTTDDVSPSPTAHRSTKARLDNVLEDDHSLRPSAYRHDNTPKGLTKVGISTDSPLSFTDGSAVAGKEVETGHRGRLRTTRAPHDTGSPYMQTRATSRASPGAPSLSSRSARSSLHFANREGSPEPTSGSTLRKKHAQALKLNDEARKRVQKVTNAQPLSTASRALTSPMIQKSLAQINHKYSVALAGSVRSATQTRAPNLDAALGRMNISQGDAFGHAVAAIRSGSKKRELVGAKDDHDEVFASPGTQWPPTPATLSPAKAAKSDRSVATDASNADEETKQTCHMPATPGTITAAAIAKLKITPESEGIEVSAELAQLQALGIASDEEHAAGDEDDDDSDGKYVPTTPSGRSHKRPSPCKTPRTPRPSMIVVLRAPPEKLFHISLRPERVAEIPVEGKCFLFTLPLEVRKQIWRHLLLATRPIQVMNGWSQLCRWQQLDLHPAVLAASRAVFDEAVRVLYGENDFRYLVRDKAGMPGRKSRWRGRRDRSRDAPNPCAIDAGKYGRYFRRLELRMERNRMTAEYDGVLASALDILLGVGVELHRLTVDVSPRRQVAEDDDDDDDDDDDTEDETSASMSDWFHPDGEVNAALKALDTDFIHIHVFTPETDNHASRGLRCIIDKRREVSELEVLQACDQQHQNQHQQHQHQHQHQQHQQRDDASGVVQQPGDIITSREDMRLLIQTRQAEAAGRLLDKLHLRIESACRDPGAAVRKGWFEPLEEAASREWRRERFGNEPRAYYPGGEADDSGDEDYSD